MYYVPSIEHFILQNLLCVIKLWMITTLYSCKWSIFFFFNCILHIFRNIYYNYIKNHVFLMINWYDYFFINDGNAFFGYVLPWGQRVFELQQLLPIIFNNSYFWNWYYYLLWGNFSVDQRTLNKFYSYIIYYLF